MKGKTFLVYIFALISISLWGFSYIWSNELIAYDVPVYYFIFIRVSMAGIILLAVNLLTRQYRHIRREHLLQFILLALCEPFIYFIAETYGIKETESPTISSMVIATVPIFSMIVGYVVFKEKITKLNVLGLVVTLSGLALVLFTTLDHGVGRNFILGLVLLMVAVIVEVIHASLTKKLSADYSPQVIVMYQFLIGAVFFLPVFLTEGLENYEPWFMTWDVVKPILCLAVLCSSLAFTLWAVAIKNLGLAKSSVFLAMISVVTALGAVMMGHEKLGLTQWIGIGIASAGIILSQYSKKTSGNEA